MVLGKTGVGKSATINSIFDEVKFRTDAFQLGTKKVQDVVGTVQGIKVRVIDTPGLLPFWADQRKNQKILQSVKMFIQKSPPAIVLYLDRLDMQSRDDMPLLRTITDIFGQSIWFNAIVVLTHAASAPPEGPNGTATSYEPPSAPPLPYILSTLLQSRPQMKLPQEQFGDDNDDALDDDIDESSDEESSEYDELPPFKRLTNAQLSKLS
ncbi:translocase of chloroplast 120, chloroplastic-like protein [Tanacetum coccineum]